MFYSKTTSMNIVPPLNFDIGETSSRNLSKEQALFMWYQLLIEVLKRMPSTSVSQNDLLTECRQEYSDNNTELHKIQEFEDTYDSDNVIEWYTRDTFLYRLLNKALRTKNITVIFKFRFVLVDLHNRLVQLHADYIRSLKSQTRTKSELIVFRGQGLTLAELQSLKDNVNGQIAMNSFLSTTISSELALGFAGDGSGRPIIESVFFEILCPVKNYFTKPFANIQQYAYLKTENEVLFTIGTIFQINFVEELTDKIWHVKLTLCDDEGDLSRNELVDNLKSDIGEAPEISTLANLLLDMNQTDKAKHFYNMILKDLPFDHCDRIHVKNNIGRIHLSKGNYSAAIKCFKQALKINRKLMPHDFDSISSIINNIGHAHNELCNYLQSIKYHRKALRIQKQILADNDPKLATTFNNLGVVYKCLSNYRLALKYHEKAKQIRISCLPETHPDLGETFDNIGETYLSKGYLNAAQINLEKGLDIRLKSLINDHPSLATSHSNLGCVYAQIGNLEKALEHHKTSLDISLKSLPKDHPDLARTYNNIAECYSELDSFTSALFYHKKALRIRLKSLPVGHPDIIISYTNIGSLYIDEKKYKLALKYLKKGISQSSPSTNKEVLARVYCNLGTLYEDKSNSGMAIKYYKRAISVELECDESNTSQNLAMIYTILGQFYFENYDLTNALIQFKKALEIGENCLEFDDNTIRLVLPNIVKVFQAKEDYVTALEYITRLLNILLKNPTTGSDDLATTYFNIGYINYCKQDNKQAILNYRTALRYASSTNPNLGQLYYSLALIYDDRKDFHVALQNYENALQFFSNSDDLLASTYNNIGLIYCFKRNYTKALCNYHKALEINVNDDELTSTVHYNIAVIHNDKKDYKLALKFYRMALEALEKNKEENEDLLIKIYNNMGGIYNQTLNYQEGLNYCQKVLKLEMNSKKVSKNHDAIATTYSNLGIIYLRQCNYPSAAQSFEKALEIASKSLTSDHPHIIEYRNYIALTKRHLQCKDNKNA